MITKKEIIEFIKNEVKFLTENQDFSGSYKQIDDKYSVVVCWTPGWGNEIRDDAIQLDENPDYALEARISLTNLNDTPDYWNMYANEEGEVFDGVGLVPNDDYEGVADYLLSTYEAILEDENKKEVVEESGKNKIAKFYEKHKKELKDRSKKKTVKEEVKHELPSTVSIDLNELIEDDVDIEEIFLNDLISDYLSNTYGFLHFGFNYDVSGDKVFVTDIAWDTSESLKETKTLTEGTSNFGSNDIINLCSPYQSAEDFEDIRKEEKEVNPDLTDEDLDEIIDTYISDYYNNGFEQVQDILKDVEDYVEVVGGYYEGYYIEFKFDNGEELADNWVPYSYKEDVINLFTQAVNNIKKGLKKSIEEGLLVGYGVAYKFSNGETGYNLTKSMEKDLKSLEEAMKKVLEEGLKYIEEELIDEE